MRRRRLVLILLVSAPLGLAVLLAGLWVYDARLPTIPQRMTALNDRLQLLRYKRFKRMGVAPREEIKQIEQEIEKMEAEEEELKRERDREWNSWPARLRREIRRRTGWGRD